MNRIGGRRSASSKWRYLAFVPLVAIALPGLAAQATGPTVPPSTVVPSTTVWTASGPASFSVDKSGATGTAKFSYDAKNYVKDSVSTWTFRTTAVTEGTVHADVTYGYHHDWCNATAKLDAFVKDTTGAVVWTKSLLDSQNPCTASPYEGDDNHELVSAVEFPVKVGSVYGFSVSGSNHDNDHHLEGSLTASNLATTPPTGPPPLYTVSDAELKLQNTSWTTAAPLDAAGVDGTLAAPGEARWYKFPVQPGGQVQVDLSNLDQNYDLTMFKDIGAAFTTLASVKDLTKLSAQFAADAYSPSIYSPSIYSPSIYSPSIYSPSIYSPSIYSPSIYSPSIYSPSIYSPSIYSPSIYSPSIYSPSIYSPSIYSPSPLFLSAFASAQTRSLIAVSAREGASSETIRTATWNNTGYFYVRVYGRNGISSPTQFHLGLTATGGPCATTPLDDFTSLATIAGTVGTPQTFETVILTDSALLPQTDGMNTALADLAAATRGVVVDVSKSLRVNALNKQANDNVLCAYAKNMVAQSIRDIVNSYRGANPTMKYVVIAGGDSVIPFFRYADGAGIGPESDYVPPVLDTTASNTSLQGNFALGQDAYGSTTDLSVKGGDLPIPDLAVGRLVETAGEITSAINTYVSGGSIAPIVPKSSLVTGYDFLTSAADAVQGNFSKSLGAFNPVLGVGADTLITDPGVKTTDTTVGGQPSRNKSWTATDLTETLKKTHHDLVFLAGHFSANSALAADYSTSIITKDIAPGTFTRSLVFSAGCHSGYNLLDADGVPNLTLGLDWAQAMAQQGATFIGGTGYQYADTDFLAYSAKIYALFSDQLRTGTGAVSVGQALVKAKQAYLASIGNPTGIDQKSLIISTLFGLPMVGVDMPGDRIQTNPFTGVSTTPIPTGPAKVLGTTSATLDLGPGTSPGLSLGSNLKPALDLNGQTTGTDFSWLSGPDGVQSGPGLPALPKQIVDVTSTGEVLRGVGFFGGTYQDTPGVLPLTGAPTTEQNGIHTNFLSPVFYPQKLATVNYTGDLGSDGRTRLVVTAAQYRSDANLVTNTLRKYDSLGLQLFYSKNFDKYAGNIPALAAAPSISAVDSTVTGGTISFSTHVSGDPSAGIQKVWVTYTGETGSLHGKWASVDLVQDAADSTLWKGTLAFDPLTQTASDMRFIVQALNGVGMVSLDNNLGAYYTPGVTVGALAASTASLALSGATTIDPTTGAATIDPLPASGPIGGTLTVGATVTPLVPEKTPVTFSLGSVSAIGLTDVNGHATATLPLQDAVGNYQVIASFGGATASAPFTIDLASTNLTLEAATPTRTPQVSAVLTDKGGRPIAEQTVVFTVIDPTKLVGDPKRVLQAAVITDPAGRASQGSLTLGDGAYPVSASFAGTPTRYLSSRTDGSLLVDTVGPVGVGTPDPTGIINGWYHDDVTVHWTCTDGGAGVDNPCHADTSIVGEGTHLSSTVTVSDVLGNSSEATSAVVQIDRTGPTVSGTPTVAPVNGWYRSDVSVAWTCSDALSDLAAGCPANSLILGDGEGKDQFAQVSVADVAGNVTIGTSAAVNIDSAAPNTAIDLADPSTAWALTSVAVTLTPYDALSGVDVTHYTIDGVSFDAVPTKTSNGSLAVNFTVTVDGTHDITWWSVDKAGNTEGLHKGTVRIESGAPTIRHEYQDVGSKSLRPANPAGWNNTPVKVHFICTAGVSGLKSCTSDVVVPSDTTGTRVYGAVVSNSGKTDNEEVVVNVDTIAPKAIVTGVVAGKTYDLGSVPIAVCTTTDERSGVKTPATASSTIVGSTVTVTCSGAMDVADNAGASVSLSYKIDDINAEGLSRLATKYLKASNLSNTQGMIQKLNNDLKTKKFCTFILDVKALGNNFTPAQVADLIFWTRKVDPTCPA